MNYWAVSVKNYHFLVKHLKLMPNHEDFELKKLLINILVILSHDSAVVPVRTLLCNKLQLRLIVTENNANDVIIV